MPSRRATDWIDSTVSISTTTGNQTLISLMSGVAPVNVRRQTLIRTIIMLDFYSTTVGGAWGTQSVATGIGITSQEAFAAGVVADPVTANDQPSRGWIYRSRFVVAQNGAGSPILTRVRADIRAARKLDDGECFFVMDNTTDLGTAFTVQGVGLIRQLWLLP